MGFFSNIKNRARGQIAPVMPMAPQAPRPISEMPLTPEQMARKAEFERNKAIENERNVISKYGSRENMERMIRDSFTNPIQNMPQRPRMPEALPPRRGPMNRGLPGLMNQMQGEPRMMMSGGRDANMVNFLNSDPRQQMFGIETRIGILENQLQEALANNDRQSYDMIVQEINDADAQRINIMNSMNPIPTIPDPRVDRMIGVGRGRTQQPQQRQRQESLDDILADLEKKN